MNEVDFFNTFIRNADSLLQATLKDSLDNNPAYCQAAKEEELAESDYITMAESFTAEQKAILERWIEKRDILNAEYSTLTYIQGYIDCLRLLKVLHPDVLKGF